MAGAPKGNGNARKAREWTDQIRYVLENYQNSSIKRGMALRGIAEKLVERALEGDHSAMTEIANRLDGKPTEYTESVITQTVEHIAVSATAAWLEQALTEGTETASEKPSTH